MNHDNSTKRYFCFSINTPTDNDYQQLTDLYNSGDCRYLCYGKEHFDTEGKTPHLQGYLELTHSQRFSWIKKRLSRAHLEIRRGSRTQARDYCFKDDENPVEYGHWKPDRQGQRNEMTQIKRKLDDGATEQDIATEHFSTWCRYNKHFKRYKSIMSGKRTWKTQVIVLWGPSETGKTSYVYENSDPLPMEYMNNFWSPYSGEPVVLWDDFSPDIMTRETFLKMTDRYPYQLRQMGAWTQWLPKTLYITSNYDPRTWYGVDDAAVLRRLDRVIHKTSNK